MKSLFYVALAISAGLSSARSVDPLQSRAKAVQGQAQGNQGGQCINSNLIQTASSLTGQESGTDGIKPGQAPSATDPDNFVNFCQGQQLTNGTQNKAGSCNSIPMGRIPATSNMISAMITNPQPGKTIAAGTTFNISVQTSHLAAGKFTNPTTTYYTAPQDLDGAGDIIGHCHVTVQDIGSLDSTKPPDPSQFVFFKGIDDAGNGRGLLQAQVTGGLPAGTYRVCTMIAAQNHQPVAMPVAQRGAQDDCTKFEVTGGGGGGAQGGGQAGGAQGGGQAGGGQAGGAQGGGNQGTQASTAAAQTSSAAAQRGGQRGGGNGRGRASKASSAVAQAQTSSVVTQTSSAVAQSSSAAAQRGGQRGGNGRVRGAKSSSIAQSSPVAQAQTSNIATPTSSAGTQTSAVPARGGNNRGAEGANTGKGKNNTAGKGKRI